MVRSYGLQALAVSRLAALCSFHLAAALFLW